MVNQQMIMYDWSNKNVESKTKSCSFDLINTNKFICYPLVDSSCLTVKYVYPDINRAKVIIWHKMNMA